MMPKEIISHYSHQIMDAIHQLSDTDYSFAIEQLGKATIGQHVRHIIELYEELYNGYETGVVCYDNRKRDYAIETNRMLAIERLQHISVSTAKTNKPLQLKCCYATQEGEDVWVETNYLRELIYNIEHMVHHMALLRVGLNQIATIELPNDFGIAVSTIRHKNVCAQ